MFYKRIITKVSEIKKNLKNYLNNIHRKTELKELFQTKEQTSENKLGKQEPVIKSKSDWEANKNHQTIKTLINVFYNDLIRHFKKKNLQSIIFVRAIRK